MVIKIHETTPQKHKIQEIKKLLEKKEIIVVPTDSVYAFACLLSNKKGIENLLALKRLNKKTARFSIAVSDLNVVSQFTEYFGKTTFKILKKNLPGPFTIILNANNKIPAIFQNKRKKIGIRMPDNTILQELLKSIDEPLVLSSVTIFEEDVFNHEIDPLVIETKYGNQVGAIIDGGIGKDIQTAVIDCTQEEPEIIREGIIPTQL